MNASATSNNLKTECGNDVCCKEISAESIDINKGLIPILQDTQEQLGYLPENILEKISEITQIPLSQIYGVVTFYAQFTLKPKGKHTIRVCKGTACHVKGADTIIEALKDHLDVEVDETTEDRVFTLEKVACLGTCFLAPVMMIDESYYGELNIEKAQSAIDEYREKVKGVN